MARVNQASKRKRITKAVPALGAAGLTFSLVGGASASTLPNTEVQQAPNYTPTHAITLGEEEIADVSLATFHLFDKEKVGGLVQEARGCGGCRGCRGCGGRGCGVRGCRVGGCGVGCRGCAVGCGGCGGGGCCLSWGACRVC